MRTSKRSTMVRGRGVGARHQAWRAAIATAVAARAARGAAGCSYKMSKPPQLLRDAWT